MILNSALLFGCRHACSCTVVILVYVLLQNSTIVSAALVLLQFIITMLNFNTTMHCDNCFITLVTVQEPTVVLLYCFTFIICSTYEQYLFVL